MNPPARSSSSAQPACPNRHASPPPQLPHQSKAHLAATLSFFAVLCITISFPLACSSGGVMYLQLPRQ
jgi:hypothetical protein